MDGTERGEFLTSDEYAEYAQHCDLPSSDNTGYDLQAFQTNNDIQTKPDNLPPEALVSENRDSRMDNAFCESSNTATDCPPNTASTGSHVSPSAGSKVTKRGGRKCRPYAPGDVTTIRPSETAFFRDTDLATEFRLKPDCGVTQESAMLHQKAGRRFKVNPNSRCSCGAYNTQLWHGWKHKPNSDEILMTEMQATCDIGICPPVDLDPLPTCRYQGRPGRPTEPICDAWACYTNASESTQSSYCWFHMEDFSTKKRATMKQKRAEKSRVKKLGEQDMSSCQPADVSAETNTARSGVIHQDL